MSQTDELRLKNALRCQIGLGSRHCINCPYSTKGGDNSCDISKLASDVLEYLKQSKRAVDFLQEQLAKVCTDRIEMEENNMTVDTETTKLKDFDPVNHPQHYADGKYEVIDFIESTGKQRSFYLGNAVKYISRAGKKDPSKKKEDLKKAIWYLERYLKWQREPVPTSITTEQFLKDKGLDGTIRGFALEILVENNNAAMAIKLLKAAIEHDE